VAHSTASPFFRFITVSGRGADPSAFPFAEGTLLVINNQKWFEKGATGEEAI